MSERRGSIVSPEKVKQIIYWVANMAWAIGRHAFFAREVREKLHEQKVSCQSHYGYDPGPLRDQISDLYGRAHGGQGPGWDPEKPKEFVDTSSVRVVDEDDLGGLGYRTGSVDSSYRRDGAKHGGISHRRPGRRF